MLKVRWLVSFILPMLFISFVFADDYSRIETLIKDGWWDDAYTALKSELKSSPDDAEANFLMGKTCFLLKDWEGSEKYLEHAIELDDTNSVYHYWLGNAKALRAQNGGIIKMPGRAKACKREYERAIELDTTNTEARFGLMQFYLQAPGFLGGDKDKARLQADSIAYYDTLKGYQAHSVIFEAIDEDYARAEMELTDAIAIDTLNLTPYFWYGYFLARHDRYNEAESLAYRALTIDSSNTAVYYSLADIEVKDKRYPEAIAHYEQIMTLDSTDLLASFQLAKTLILADSDLVRAETLLDKYIEAKLKGYWPPKPEAYRQLALIYDKQGKYDRAKTALETGLAMNPGDSEDEMKEFLKQVKKKLK